MCSHATSGSARSRSRKRLVQPEQKLQHHMDSEDQRVKELTECVLYDFLPAALNVMLPRTEDTSAELDADKCRVSTVCTTILHSSAACLCTCAFSSGVMLSASVTGS